MLKTKLKWGKQQLELEVNPAEKGGELKQRICKLTGVPVDRQKLSCPKAWKGSLGDDIDLGS